MILIAQYAAVPIRVGLNIAIDAGLDIRKYIKNKTIKLQLLLAG